MVKLQRFITINNTFAFLKFLPLLYLAAGFSHFAYATDRSAAQNWTEQWAGKWDSSPDPAENPSIYYFYEITLKGEGFSWKSVQRDVPYGPNEIINTGYADFDSAGQAMDIDQQLLFYLGTDASGRKTLTIKQQASETAGVMFYKVPKYFKAGFNCARAATVIEKAICSDRRLAMADAEINRQYKIVRKKLSGDNLKFFKTGQRQWIKQRNQCREAGNADTSCLALSYAGRLATLQKIISPVLGDGEGVNAGYLQGFVQSGADQDSSLPLLLAVASKDRDWAVELMKNRVEYQLHKQGDKTALVIFYQYDSVCWPDDCVVKVRLKIIADNNGVLDVTRNTQSSKH